MDYSDILDNFFKKFSQLFQLSFGFALGLAFAQANITVGWLFAWIFIYEFIFFVLTAGTKYYDILFRLAYNCLFIISVSWGQYIYYGKTTFQNFLYPDTPNSTAKKNSKKKMTNKGTIMERLDNLFNLPLEEEEKRYKRKRLQKRYKQASV